MALQDKYNKKLEAKFQSLIPQLQAAGVPLLAGSDSGAFNSYVYPGASLHDELSELVRAGLTPAQALQAASINGARWLGVAARTGSIAVGKDADLLLLSANPLADIRNTRRIAAVVTGGKVYTAAELAALVRPLKQP